MNESHTEHDDHDDQSDEQSPWEAEERDREDRRRREFMDRMETEMRERARQLAENMARMFLASLDAYCEALRAKFLEDLAAAGIKL